ncbi:LacI family transcriptional regulator [Opitutaceae bacterium EW11]|nr:LacI family transcriptional regulator [Opitutaceae bacterium EW11]
MPVPSKRKGSRPATLADVGREAGVSAMAVSAVLNGARTSSRTAPETRRRILEAAEKLRYRPNAAARALAERRMNTIGVAAVFERSQLNQYFLEVFNGILETAAQHDQTTTVFTLHDWEKDSARLDKFCDGRIDGLVLIAPRLTKESVAALPTHTPSVGVHANLAVPRWVNLESDEERGAYDMVKYMIELGHRRIMHLTGPRGLLGVERRVTGFKRAMSEAGLRRENTIIVEAGFTTPEGYRALRDWMKASSGQKMPQAIFCANDGVATGCMEVLAEVGIRVPSDISLAGFDDTLAARSTVPQLTTVRQPLHEMGNRAVEVLLERIEASREGKIDRAAQNIVFSTELVLRGTVAPPPSQEIVVPQI